MKKILVPIDFSKASRNAFFYASRMALYNNVPTVTLLHCEEEDNPNSFEDFKSEIEEIRLLAHESWIAESECSNKLEINVDFDLHYLSCNGDVVTEILNASEEFNYDVIVMGTNGINSAKGEDKFGSITSKVICNSSKTVIAVPVNYKFTVPKKIVYAVDYDSFDAPSIKSLEYFASNFESEITLLHISPSLEVFQKERFKNYRQTMEELYIYENMKMHFIENGSPIKCLSEYLEEHNIDLVAMLNRHSYRDLSSSSKPSKNLITTSYSQLMSLKTQIPLMVFH